MEEKMLADFTASCKKNEKKLFELLKVYDLAKLGEEVQEQECKDVYNLVLAENEFFVGKDDTHGIYKFGARVTKEEDMFMLSDEDFEKVLVLANNIMVEREITNKDGYYLTDWLGMKMKAWRELVDFIIQNIVPESFRATFWNNRLNVTMGNRLIDAFRNSIKAA